MRKKEKQNKTIFSWSFRITIVVTVFLLTICTIYNQMLIWVESTLFGIWTLFSLIFTYAIRRKWECLREEGYWKHHYVSKEEQWVASIILYIISLMITIGFLIDLVIKMAH